MKRRPFPIDSDLDFYNTEDDGTDSQWTLFGEVSQMDDATELKRETSAING